MPDIPIPPSLDTEQTPDPDHGLANGQSASDPRFQAAGMAMAAPPEQPFPAPEQPLPPTVAASSVEVPDPVEEVLQQTSEQALRLSHLEDVLSALGQSLADVRDEMQAGFAEMRAAVEQSAGAGDGGAGESFRRNAIDRFDDLDLQIVRTRRRQALLTLLALLQILLVAALGGYLYVSGHAAAPVFSDVPAYTTPPPAGADAAPPTEDSRSEARKPRRHKR